MMPDFKFCPVCGAPLELRARFGAERLCCTNQACGFIYFLDPKLVAVALVEQAGRILLGRRNHNPGKGRWSFPSGYVNRGEQVEDAARREVKEETGLDVRLGGLLNVYSEPGSPNVLLVYLAFPLDLSQPLVAQPEEVQALDYFDLNNLPELAFPYDRQILADWSQKQLESRKPTTPGSQ